MNSALKNDLLKFTAATARGAGKILKSGFTRTMGIRYKGRIDPVTEFDLKSEKYVVGEIRRHYAGAAIITEETPHQQGNADLRFIIDPLDGTVNFAHGFPVYCVSIGVELAGQPLLGVVYDPERDELFHAVAGGGAFCNGRRLHVSGEKSLHRALLATGFAYDIGTARRNNLGLFARMAKQAQGIRRPGSAAIDLCWLAAGRVDGFWELKLHPWDTAAASVLVSEAGGRLSRIDGRPYSIFDRDLLASNTHLHNAMMAVLSGVPHSKSTARRTPRARR